MKLEYVITNCIKQINHLLSEKGKTLQYSFNVKYDEHTYDIVWYN